MTDRPSVEIMIVDVKGSAPREPGATLIWRPGGEIEGTIGGGALERQTIQEAERLWSDPARATAFIEYPLSERLGQCCGGVARVFLRKLLPPRRALICGAGHVSQALARLLAETPIRAQVVDPRPEWADPARFPSKIEVVVDDCEAAVREAAARADETFLLIMTHDHPTDQALCALALRYPFRWIGLIGSRTKWTRFRQRLGARGFSAAELARISCPIGDPALGRSPQEIAIGVAAQILALHHGVEFARSAEAAPKAGPRGALILAGGASSRMGQWKGGLEIDGAPLVLAHARAVESAGADVWKSVYPTLARPEAERIIPPPHRIVNATPEAPMFASIQLGLRELLRERFDLESVLLTPVDVPPLPGDLIAALWDRHETSGAWITRPEINLINDTGATGTKIRHGHPIIIDRNFFPLILAADPADARLDFLARDLPENLKATLELDVTAGLHNMNTPEDYARAAL